MDEPSYRTLHLPASFPLPVSVDDPPPREIVRGKLHQDPVSREDSDVVHSHLSRDMGQDLVAIVKLDPEHGVRQRLHYRPLDLDGILLRQAPGFPLEHAEIRRRTADAKT